MTHLTLLLGSELSTLILAINILWIGIAQLVKYYHRSMKKYEDLSLNLYKKKNLDVELGIVVHTFNPSI